MSDEERRGAPRINRRFMVKYRKPGETAWMMSPIKDMSATGIRFIGETTYQKNTVLELQLFLPTSTEPIGLSGVVKWEHGSAYTMGEHGIEFADLTPDQRERLKVATAFFLKKRESD